MEDLAAAMTDSLPRDGSAPMTGDMSMNGNRITNLGAGTRGSDAARIDQVLMAVPVATIIPYAGGSLPTSDWMWASGQALSRTDYAALFAAIGTTYGSGNGSTTFNLPDLRDRTVVGVGNMGGSDANRVSNFSTELGNVGGGDTHSLNYLENGPHSHSGTTSWNGDHVHDVWRGRAYDDGGINDPGSNFGRGNTPGSLTSTGMNSTGGHNHTFQTNIDGNGQPHNNMQPFIALNYIIRVTANDVPDDMDPDDLAAETAARIAGDENLQRQVSAIAAGSAITTENSFATRDAFVAWDATASGKIAGMVIFAAGLPYVYDGVSTAIPDLPGWVPGAPSMPEHWAAISDGSADAREALAAWAAHGGEMSMRPGAIYALKSSEGSLIDFAAGAVVDMRGAMIRADFTDLSATAHINIGAGCEIDGFHVHFSDVIPGTPHTARRFVYIHERAVMTNPEISADTAWPRDVAQVVRDVAVKIGGPDITIRNITFRNIYKCLMGDPDVDTPRAVIDGAHFHLYGSGIIMRTQEFCDSWTIRHVRGFGKNPNTIQDPGENIITGGGPHLILDDVQGDASGEHFVYLSVAAGTPGLRASNIGSWGSGQCGLKLRGWDRFTLVDIHGGGTSAGNSAGTNEDGLHMEFCHNGRIFGLSTAQYDTNPGGYDGVFLGSCQNIDFFDVRIDTPYRSVFRVERMNAVEGYDNVAPDGITVNGITVRKAQNAPLLSIGNNPNFADPNAQIGNFNVQGLDYRGGTGSLISVDAGLALQAVNSGRIRIAGISDTVAVGNVADPGMIIYDLIRPSIGQYYGPANADAGANVTVQGRSADAGNVAQHSTSYLRGDVVASPAVNTLGPGMSFGRPNGSRRGALVASIQTGAAAHEVGLAIFAGATSTATEAVQLEAILHHTGDLEVARNGRGLILRDPSGTRYLIQVSAAGALTATPL